MLSARECSARLADLLRTERSAMAELLVALSRFDRDRGWAELGYTSLFHHLQREPQLTAGPAFYRMTAARLIQEYSELVEPLRDGRLCLSSVGELSKVLTRENLATVLPRFFGASRQEAREIAAELSPREVPARTVVTPIAEPAAVPGLSPRAGPGRDPQVPADAGRAATSPLLPVEVPPSAPRVETRAIVDPRTPELRRMHVTVTRRLVVKLAAARDALSHSHPGASDDEIIEAGLDLLLDRAAKRRGLVEKPRETPPPSHGDRIPASVKRAVWVRDGGRCTFPLAGGGVCGATDRVEYDHVIPEALGGKPTVENTRLRCRTHDIVEARAVFGDAVMDRYTRAGRGPSSGTRSTSGDHRT